ncbi:MAG: DUF3846 domain-containing protein [Coriobacteriaceae bacterium]|nr:DUF3846 domain-containing protein [Coriobacteriaceae bacterium]
MAKIKGVIVPTNGAAAPCEIQSSLRGLQAAVGGNIEAYDGLFGDDMTIYVNDMGKLTQAPNRAVYARSDDPYGNDEGKLIEVLYGPVVVVGFDWETGESISLTDRQVGEVISYFTDTSMPGSGAVEAAKLMLGKNDVESVEFLCSTGRDQYLVDERGDGILDGMSTWAHEAASRLAGTDPATACRLQQLWCGESSASSVDDIEEGGDVPERSASR